jgi:hypothetical protein
LTLRVPRSAGHGRAGTAAAVSSDLVLGIDFTSAPSRRKPITVAVGRLVLGRSAPAYEVHAIRSLATRGEFASLLSAPGPWLGGFDLPFGQPRTLIEHENWPTDWREFVRFYCGQPRESLREVFRRWCAGRPAGDKFAWRKADKPAGSSPAMRWTNPPVAWMMHAGIGVMLEAGLAFPAHGVPDAAENATETAGPVRRIALEAYPGFTARQVCRKSYKSDVRASQTAERTARRREILGALEAGAAGLAPRLVIDTLWKRRIVADGSGDLLDAVICGLQAAHAATLPAYGLPADLDPLEGWIASVPPPHRS